MNKPQKPARDTKRLGIIRIRIVAIIATAVMLALVARLALLMLVDPNDYRSSAIDQYTYEMTIPAKRGSIYDTSGRALAISATVQNVFISPYDIQNDSQALIVANGLSNILGVDAATVAEKCANRKSKYQMIKRSVSEEEEAAVRQFVTDNGLSKIVCMEESTKRYYPYGTLACHVLGFVGTDNIGLSGLESTYNSYLAGTDGRSVMGRDGKGNNLPFKYESYIDAEDGYGIVTTIDWTIQSILEKYLYEAYVDNTPNGKVSGVIMDVNTGEILAMGIYPSFDLNSYSKLSAEYQAKLDAFVGTEEEKAAYKSELQSIMWNNTTVTQTYEPGSTFKIITGSVAIEEGAIDPEKDTFYCGGGIKVEGLSNLIHCHSNKNHGTQLFAEAIVNSCNPAFVQIGQKIGTKTFEAYFERYGYNEKSGVDIPGETSSIYFGTTGGNFGNVELSVYSFGQTFKVTMIQHLRAVSTIANGGYLVTPHLVKSVTDSEGKTVKTFDYGNTRQVVSGNTAQIVLDALINSTKNAAVSGYNVVSKTGTSEKRDTEEENDYISSCVTFAPAEDPQIAILITVDEPSGPIYGSVVAAPVVSNILTEVLPYLGIQPNNAETIKSYTLDDFRGSTVEAVKLLVEDKGMTCKVVGSGSTVLSQMPRMGTSINTNDTLYLYTDESSVSSNYVTVPDLSGKTYSECTAALSKLGLNIDVDGIYNNNYSNAFVIKQVQEAGSSVLRGAVVEVEFRYNEEIE